MPKAEILDMSRNQLLPSGKTELSWFPNQYDISGMESLVLEKHTKIRHIYKLILSFI